MPLKDEMPFRLLPSHGEKWAYHSCLVQEEIVFIVFSRRNFRHHFVYHTFLKQASTHCTGQLPNSTQTKSEGGCRNGAVDVGDIYVTFPRSACFMYRPQTRFLCFRQPSQIFCLETAAARRQLMTLSQLHHCISDHVQPSSKVVSTGTEHCVSWTEQTDTRESQKKKMTAPRLSKYVGR